MSKRVGAPHQVAAMMKGNNKKGGLRWVERPETNSLEDRRRAADAAFLLLNSKLTGKGGKR